MRTYCLTFPDQETAETLMEGISGSVDVIGVMYETIPMGAGAAINTPLPGWHVNLLCFPPLPENLEQYLVFPETPRRVFAAYTNTNLIPAEVTMGQCRLALYDLKGIKTDEQFYNLVNLLPEEMRERSLLELKTRVTVRKDHPLVVLLAETEGWDLDDLFDYASKQ